MMNSFVRAPNAGHWGKATTAIFLLAIFLGAPAWVLAFVLVGGVVLFAHLSDRAYWERDLR